MYQLWVWVFLALIEGVLVARYTSGYLGLVVAALIFLPVLGWKRNLAKIVVTACCAMVFAFFYFRITVPPVPLCLEETDSVIVRGTIDGFPNIKDNKTILILETGADDPYLRKIRVSLYYAGHYENGQQIEARMDLKPALQPRNPGAFDYREYLANEGIYYLGSVKSAADVHVLRDAGSFDGLINWLRGSCLNAVEASLTADEASVLEGMLLGKVDMIDNDAYDTYQKSGIIHLFSVSGLHVGFLVLMAGWCAELLRLRAWPRFSMIAGLLVMYGFLAAWPVAVERSVITAVLCLLAYYVGRKQSLLNSLCLAGSLILIIDIQAVFSISFQLTFLATWGLVTIYPALRRRLPLKGWLADLFILPFCAELPIIPVIAWYFNMLSPWSILGNLLTAWASGAAVILGFAALVFSPVSIFLAGLFLYPAGLLIEWINGAAGFAAGLPAAALWVKNPGWILMTVYYCGLAALLYCLSSPARRWKSIMPAMAIIGLALAVMVFPPGDDAEGRLKIVFVDVGQGDCIYIRTPGGKNLLIDGGGSAFYDVGRLVVAPFLKQAGVRNIDLVMNSHPDIDHVAGLAAVLKDFQVGALAVPQGQQNNEQYAALASPQNCSAPDLISLERGQVLNIEPGVTISVLGPEVVNGGRSLNDSSMVLRLDYHDFSMLLPGDISADTMDGLAKNGLLKACSVVKVPHHGSRNSVSEDFYNRLSPLYAVIQVGKGNSFGHPSQPVLELLNTMGIRCVRTDQDGAITMISDGHRLQVEGYLSGKEP